MMEVTPEIDRALHQALLDSTTFLYWCKPVDTSNPIRKTRLQSQGRFTVKVGKP